MIIEIHGERYNLPQIAQYESITYQSGLCCSHCSNFNRSFGYWMDEMCTDKVVGFIVNQQGEYEIVKECKYCNEKYRFHLAKRWYRDGDKICYDIDYWKREVGIHLLVNNHDYLKID